MLHPDLPLVSDTSDWQKGGIRYAKLKEIVPAYLAPEKVEAFFVAVRGARRGRLLNPFTPLHREFVVAATPTGVKVLRLKLPGVFRASIKSTVFEGHGEAVSWNGKQMVVDGVAYKPISFHTEDAQDVARLVAPPVQVSRDS
jgi:hypothetical protein